MRRLALATLLVLEALAILGVTAPALAHAPEQAAAGARQWPRCRPAVTWLPLLILTAFLFVASRSRRAVVGLLIGLLAVLAFETGLHSVHHLAEQRDPTRCIVESVSSNRSGGIGEVTIVVSPAETADLTPCLKSVAPPQRSLRPDQGRALPFLA
jgi:hypothetical protein